jgi:septal ring-binding cell division protein DamX
MSSRDRLETYIQEHQLEGVSAARVERNGELYHVLILGIYETRQLAEQASLYLPPPLETQEPWIRELRALQEAIVRGNAMAGSAAPP